MTREKAPTQTAVLAILRASPGLTSREVARALWPDSPAWAKRTNMRNGRNGAVGGTMPMKAGVILGRLWRRNLVYPEYASSGQARWFVQP